MMMALILDGLFKRIHQSLLQLIYSARRRYFKFAIIAFLCFGVCSSLIIKTNSSLMTESMVHEHLPFLISSLFSYHENFSSIDAMLQTKDNGFFITIQQICPNLPSEKFLNLKKYIAEDSQKLRRFLGLPCINYWTILFRNANLSPPFNGVGLLSPIWFDLLPISDFAKRLKKIDEMDPSGHIRFHINWSQLFQNFQFFNQSQRDELLKTPLHRIVGFSQVVKLDAFQMNFTHMLLCYAHKNPSNQSIMAFVLLMLLIWDKEIFNSTKRIDTAFFTIIRDSFILMSSLLEDDKVKTDLNEFDIFQLIINDEDFNLEAIQLDKYLINPSVEILQFLYYVFTVHHESDSLRVKILSVILERLTEYSDYDFLRTLEVLSLDVKGRKVICDMIFKNEQKERFMGLKFRSVDRRIFSFLTARERILYFRKWDELLPTRSFTVTVKSIFYGPSLFNISESPLQKPVVMGVSTEDLLNSCLKSLITMCPFVMVNEEKVISLNIPEDIDGVEVVIPNVYGVLSLATSLRLHYFTEYSIDIDLAKLITCFYKISQPDRPLGNLARYIREISRRKSFVSSLIIAYNINECDQVI